MSEERASEEDGVRAMRGKSDKLDIPAKFTADDLLKAIKVVSDRGGKGQPKELLHLFGNKSDNETFSRALTFAAKIGLLSKSGNDYNVETDGKSLLASNDESKRTLLAAKLIKFTPYRDILLRLDNEEDKKLDKLTISETWTQVTGVSSGIHIRKRATASFSSLCSYAGIIDETRKTCTLSSKGTQLLNSAGADTPQATTQPQMHEAESPLQGKLQVTDDSISLNCPRCRGNNLGILNENVVEYFLRGNKTTILVKHDYLCRDCHQQFSRLARDSVDGIRPNTGA